MRYRNLRNRITKRINCWISNETYSYLYQIGGGDIGIAAAIDKLAEEHRNYAVLQKSALQPTREHPKTESVHE